MSVDDKGQKVIRCIVSSDKMHKSRVATVIRLVKHPVAGKYVKRSSKLMFHDEQNQTRIGDEVLIVPSRPLSARKNFSLLSIVNKAKD